MPKRLLARPPVDMVEKRQVRRWRGAAMRPAMGSAARR